MDSTQKFIRILEGLQALMQEERALGDRLIKKREALGIEQSADAMKTPEGRLLLLQSNRVVAHVDHLFTLALEACDAALQENVNREVVLALRASLEAARRT